MRSISASVSVVKRGQSREQAQQAPQLRQIETSAAVSDAASIGSRSRLALLARCIASIACRLALRLELGLLIGFAQLPLLTRRPLGRLARGLLGDDAQLLGTLCRRTLGRTQLALGGGRLPGGPLLQDGRIIGCGPRAKARHVGLPCRGCRLQPITERRGLETFHLAPSMVLVLRAPVIDAPENEKPTASAP